MKVIRRYVYITNDTKYKLNRVNRKRRAILDLISEVGFLHR